MVTEEDSIMRDQPTGLVIWAVAAVLSVGGLSQAAERAEESPLPKDFLKRVAEELRVKRQFDALYERSAPKPPPTPIDLILMEMRVRRQVREMNAAAAPRPRPTPRRPSEASSAEKLKTARAVAAEAARRRTETQRARVEGLVSKGREHLKLSRFGAASKAFRLALKLDPRNEQVSQLLAFARLMYERHETEKVARRKRAETAAQTRGIDALRVPHSNTLAYPQDWQRTLARTRTTGARMLENVDEQTAKTRQALKKEVTIDVVEAPLEDVAAYFRRISGVNIVVDKDAARRPVTLKLRRVPLEAALRWVTRLTGQGFTVREGVVYVGPPEAVAEDRVVRMYDVADLLQVRRLLTRGRNMRRAVQPIIADPDDFDRIEPFEEVEVKSIRKLADELIDFLKAATGSGSWGADGEGATMVYRLGQLVVNAEPRTQEKVAEILANLRP
jgi:hypothetical protein